MVALFVVFFIIVLMSLDYFINKPKVKNVFKEEFSEKERLVIDSSSDIGITMADGGEVVKEK